MFNLIVHNYYYYPNRLLADLLDFKTIPLPQVNPNSSDGDDGDDGDMVDGQDPANNQTGESDYESVSEVKRTKVM